MHVMNKQPAVYIMASGRNGTLYTGVTSNLPQRVWQHRTGVVGGFTKRYGCKRLVWYELHSTMPEAIAREKQIKAGSRKRKLVLIEALNRHGETCTKNSFDSSLRAQRSNPGPLARTERLFWIASSLRSSQ